MMPYLPASFAPDPVFDDGEFWNCCARKELRFQACADCGELRHPPTPVCGHCHSTRTEWREAPPRAEIFTYTIIHHPADERIGGNLPYVVALLKFPGFGPVKLVSNVIADPARIHVGMQVELAWEAVEGGMFLPRFIPAAEACPA